MEAIQIALAKGLHHVGHATQQKTGRRRAQYFHGAGLISLSSVAAALKLFSSSL
jgi:hypothetical protein